MVHQDYNVSPKHRYALDGRREGRGGGERPAAIPYGLKLQIYFCLVSDEAASETLLGQSVQAEGQ